MANSKKFPNRFKFDHKKLAQLPTPEGNTYPLYYDTEVPQLAIRVNKNGTKTFLLSRRFKDQFGGSRSEKISIGRFPEVSVARARKDAETLNGERSVGINPATTLRLNRQYATLGELFEQYMDRHAREKKKRWKDIEKNFHRWFGAWSTRKASSISGDDVHAMHVELKESRGPYAANRAMQLLRAIYNKAIRYGKFTGSNPATVITMWPETSRGRFLSKDELHNFMTALESSESPNLRDFVVMALRTGQRKENVLSMRFSEIDKDVWRVSGERTKNNQPLTMQLGTLEMEIINRRKAEAKSDYVFPGEGKDGHYTDPKRAWQTFRKRAKLENFRIHDLRRSLGSIMASEGVELSLIKNTLNHKDLKTTANIYALTAKEAEKKAREMALAAYFRDTPQG